MKTFVTFAALLLLSPLAIANWQTTKFHVVLGEPLDEAHVPQRMSLPTAEQRSASIEAQQSLHATHLLPGVGGVSQASPQVTEFAAIAEKIERFLGEIATTYKAEGYLGPPAMSYDPKIGAYEIYVMDFGQSAYFNHKIHLVGRYSGTGCRIPDRVSWIALNLPQLTGESDERLFNTLAHELFHAVQDNYGQSHSSWNSCKDGQATQIEGTAEAVSSFITNQKFPGYISRHPGLDEYDYTYPFIAAGDNGAEAYQTASFFRYLMERFNGHKLMKALFSTPMGGAQEDPEIVLDWLEKCLTETCGIGQSLYFIFPNFAADIALWGIDKYHGYDEEKWQKGVLDKCESVRLKPVKGQDSVTISPIYLQPTTARCIKVSVSGLKSNQMASVKFMSEETGPEARRKLDSLHLGVSRLGGTAESIGGAFDCREAARRTKLPVCLDKPFLGERGRRDRKAIAGETNIDTNPEKMAKMWLGDRQSSAGGAFENVYIVSDTSTPPQLHEYANNIPGLGYPLKLKVSLKYESGRSTETGEFKDMGAGINRAINTEPAQIKGGEGAAFSIAGFPDMSRMPFLPDSLLPAELSEEIESMYGDGISLIHVHETNQALSDEQFEGSTSFTVGVEKPIRFGQTGTFPAAVIQGVTMMDAAGPDMMVLPDNMNKPTGTVTVHRFDDSMLNIDLVVRFCRYSNMNFESGICRKPETITASIAKPFGWTYDPTSGFYSVMSPGQELYGKLIEEAVYGRSSSLPQDESSPFNSFGPGPGPTNNSSGGSQNACSCSCEEYEAIQQSAEDLEQRAAQSDSGIPDLSGININMMMCFAQCAEQYGRCER